MGATRPVIIRIVVVLPAPFGPRKPVTVPGSSSNETSSTTVRSPYFLVSPLTVIMVASDSTGLSGLWRTANAEAPPARVGRRPRIRWPDGWSLVIRKLTSQVLSRATRRRSRPSYAPAHGAPGTRVAGPAPAQHRARGRHRPARHRRGRLTTGTPDDRLASIPVVFVGTAILGITLFLFRRSAPLVPFLVAAALAVLSPAVTIAVPLTSYAVGRYVGRWPRADRAPR